MRWTQRVINADNRAWLNSLGYEYRMPEFLLVHGAPNATGFDYPKAMVYADNQLWIGENDGNRLLENRPTGIRQRPDRAGGVHDIGVADQYESVEALLAHDRPNA